jgi:hypothetical protein
VKRETRLSGSSFHVSRFTFHEPFKEADMPDQDQEPDVRGTVFLMVLFLMLMVGMWAIMYFQLLSR